MSLLGQDGAVLTLPFLGQRPYLQGTTLFEGIRDFAPSEIAGTFQANKLLFTDRIYVSNNLRPNHMEWPEGSPNATLNWRSNNDEGVISVWGGAPSVSPRRHLFDESEITDGAVVSDGALVQKAIGPTRHGIVPTLVSLNKHLMHQRLQKDGGRWIFARFDFLALPQEWAEIRLQIDAVLGQGRLVTSKTFVNGAEIGLIYFSWLKAQA